MFLGTREETKFVGEWSTRIVTWSLPRPTVEGWLAREGRRGAGWELEPQALTPAGTHPVLFSCGTLHGAYLSGLGDSRSRLTYEEMVVMVPFVGLRGRSGAAAPRAYLPRLFLNATLPTVGGWLGWGLNKARTRIDADEGARSYEVRSWVRGTPLLSLRWDAEAARPAQPVSQVPSFQAMRDIHEQELLGTLGPLRLAAPWVKDWSRGTVAGVSAELRVSAPFLPGLEPGVRTCAPLGPDNPLGAYALRVPFALGMPRRA